MPKLRDMIDGRLLAAFPAKGNQKPDNDDDQEQQQSQPQQPMGQPQMGKPQPGQQPGQNAIPGAPKPNAYPSPAGQHVANNIQDPYGATKDELDELNQAKLAYEMKKAQMQMKLQPVKSVVDGISQMHEMQDPNQMSPDAQMGYTDPNDPTGGNMAMSPQGGAAPGAMPGQQPPIGQPGMPPGQPKEAIRPFKLGVPTPGQGNPATMAGNPSMQQFNPAAPKPPGAGSLPGANGPGAAKPQNAIKKAQSGGSKKSGGSGGSSSSGKVAIHVHADSISSSPAKRTLASYSGNDALRAHGHKSDEECNACGEKMKAYGTSQGVRKEWEVRRGGSTNPQVKERWNKNKPGMPGYKPPKEWEMGKGTPIPGRIPLRDQMKGYGTSEGVKKEWESRGHGKREPIVDLNDKRGYNAPIDKKYVSPAKTSEDKKWGSDWDEGFNASKKSMKGGVFKPKRGMEAVAPPGREDQVKALKKKFGKKSAFKIAWSQYNK